MMTVKCYEVSIKLWNLCSAHYKFDGYQSISKSKAYSASYKHMHPP